MITNKILQIILIVNSALLVFLLIGGGIMLRDMQTSPVPSIQALPLEAPRPLKYPPPPYPPAPVVQPDVPKLTANDVTAIVKATSPRSSITTSFHNAKYLGNGIWIVYERIDWDSPLIDKLFLQKDRISLMIWIYNEKTLELELQR